MNHLFPILTALAYLFSFVLYVRFLGTGKKLTGRLGTLVLGLGLVSHYFALLERSRGLHTVPYHDLYGSMSLFGWLLALTYLGLELYHRQRSVGAFVMPFILAIMRHLAVATGVFRLLILGPAIMESERFGHQKLWAFGAPGHVCVSRYPEHPRLCGVCALFCS